MYLTFWEDQIQVKKRSNGQVISNCPICGEDGGHFYASIETGQWDCKKCQASGNVWSFLRDYKNMDNANIFQRLKEYDITQDSLEVLPKPPRIFDEKAIEYYCSKLSAKKKKEFALERGLSVAILDKYRLGINDSDEFTLPVTDAEGKIRNILRKKPGESTISIQGGEGLLFGVGDLLTQSKIIFIVEGPWSALALKEKGFRAVGTCGAGVLKDSQVSLFQGKEVYLVPDNDDAGRRGMDKISLKLKGIAEVIHTITLPVPEKKDVRDFFKDGGTLNQFENLIKQSRENLLVVSDPETVPVIDETQQGQKKLSPIPSYDEFIKLKFDPPEFLIGSEEGGALLQKDGITMISAEFGKGKTLLGLNMAWAMTKGVEDFLGFPVKKARGLYLIFEGGNSSFQKRLKAIGKGEPNPDLFVKYIGHAFDLTPNGENLTEDQKEFEAEIERLKIDFVVIDNAANVFSGDENDQKQVKPFMDYLISVQKKFVVSFIILRHWKKTQQKGGSPRRQMATGSVWWLNAVDNQICLSGEADKLILSSEKERNCSTFSPKVVEITKPDLHFKFLTDFASSGPKYTEENTLLPAWESFGATRVNQKDLIAKMTTIASDHNCSERTAKAILNNSKRFFKTQVVPGSTKSGNWIALRPDIDKELFEDGEEHVS